MRSHSKAELTPQVVDDPETDSLLLVLENAEGGSLQPPPCPDAQSGSARETPYITDK